MSSPTVADFLVVAEGRVPAATLDGVYRRLTADGPRVSGTLGLPDLPLVTVRIWKERAAFDAAHRGGGFVAGAFGYVNAARSELRLLDTDPEQTARTAVHELAHLAMLHLNPRIALNPPWVWEAVAEYLARTGPPDTSSLTCIDASSAPSLSELDEFPETLLLTRVAYLLGEYVAALGGTDALRALVVSGGDLESSLGVGRDEFERGWHRFMLDHHDFWEPGEPMSRAAVLDELVDVPLRHEADNVEARFAVDGRMTYGADAATSARWFVTDDGRQCIGGDGRGERCVHWYREGPDAFSNAPATDCLLQRWRRLPANASD